MMKKIITLFVISVITLNISAQNSDYRIPEYMLPNEYALALESAEEITIADFPKTYSGNFGTKPENSRTFIKIFEINVTEAFNFEISTSNQITSSGFEFYFMEGDRKNIRGIETTHCTYLYPDNQSIIQYGDAIYTPTYLLLWCGGDEDNSTYTIQFSKVDYSPTITWESQETATGYTIDIYDATGELVVSLEFDADGNYIGIAQRSGTLKTTEEFSFDASTLDLEKNATYYYTISALNGEETVQIKEGVFKMSDETGTAIKTVPTTMPRIVGYYNFAGQKFSEEPQKGMYIILYDNGTSEKVLKY